MNVTYYHHSGFMVETDTKVLVFDYYGAGGKYDFFDPQAFAGKDIVFFVSHGHDDHFDRCILKWADKVSYVIFEGIPLGRGTRDTLFVGAHETYDFHDMEIRTLISNDEGVAFLVKVDGKTIYHAGDLNWWHWNGEPEDFNRDIAKSYQDEIDLLANEDIDVAFVPADLRLQDKYSWATDYFMQTVGAKKVFPMHFWGEFSVCNKLKALPHGEAIVRITKENERFTI